MVRAQIDNRQGLRRADLPEQRMVGARPDHQPERRNLVLLGRPLGACFASVFAQFVVALHDLSAFERGRRSRSELRWFLDNERLHLRPHRADCDGGRHVGAGLGLGAIVVGRVAAVGLALFNDAVGCLLADLDACRLGVARAGWSRDRPRTEPGCPPRACCQLGRG